MRIEVVIALVAVLLTLLSHTVALFRWATRIEIMLRDHELRITSLEPRRGRAQV